MSKSSASTSRVRSLPCLSSATLAASMSNPITGTPDLANETATNKPTQPARSRRSCARVSNIRSRQLPNIKGFIAFGGCQSQ
jgi:hypothetical protein